MRRRDSVQDGDDGEWVSKGGAKDPRIEIHLGVAKAKLRQRE